MKRRNISAFKPSTFCLFLSILLTLFVTAFTGRQLHAQVYASSVAGTDFDIITAEDPSAFKSLTFSKSARSEMPDKRTEDAPLFQHAFIFEASFADGSKVKIYVDAKFKNKEAAKAEARRYTGPLGRLPAVLRQGVRRLVVHQGGRNTTAFSDVGLIVIYSENATRRIATHDLEETIFHEAIHAAWDARYAKSDAWKRAQMADGSFATLYAKSKPTREDLAESALFAYAVLKHPERIPAVDRTRIQKAVPHRIAFIAGLLKPLAEDAAGTPDEKTQASSTQTADRRPNVILILADDLAPGDLAGGDGKPTRTPHLDAMAKHSARFSQAYSGSCVCAPARAALLTGRYPQRTGVVTLNMNTYPTLTRLRPDETTIADVLKKAGYATGLIGKWHTGRGEGYHPLDRGFDEFEGFDGSGDIGYFQYKLSEQRKATHVKDQYLTDDLTRRAIKFVRRNKEKPFFLHLAHYAPHRPLEAPAETVTRYRKQGFNKPVATIYAMIEVMDRGIGELLTELDKLKLADDTIVIFASDNGPDPLTGERFNHDLRGTKYQINEGGIRVPLFVRWPGKLEPGKRQQVVSFVDLMPTILELCDVRAPVVNALDGKSFATVLKDASAQFSPMRFWQWNRGIPNYTHNAAVREGRFKLVRPFVTRGSKLKDSTLPDKLYNLQADPSESDDVASNHPDVARRLGQQLQRWSEEVEKDRLRQAALPLKKSLPNAKNQPNIVLLLVDDLGWSDLGSSGHRFHRTPNIDRLANDGMRFTNAYAPAPICSASRASILTGKTPARLGFEFVTKNEAGHQQLDIEAPLKTPVITLNLPTEETTIAERLAPLGYKTAFFGKWHVSQHYQKRYLAWHPGFGPKKQGFATAVEDFGDHPYSWRNKKPGPGLPDGEFPVDSMIQRTAEFIRKQKDAEQPWFLMASSFYVHTPVKNRCRWLVEDYQPDLKPGAANRQKRLEYAAFVETLDHHIGTVLGAIDDSGQRENTMVVLISDNGGHPEYCSNAPLRGSKWNLYEGGIRVPMMVRWPEHVKRRSTCETPVIGYDLLPTFVDLAGGEVAKEESSIDGVSIKPAFANPDWRPKRTLLWHFPYYHPEKTYSKAIDDIGVGDFATSKTRPQSAIREANYKLIRFAEDNRTELYDLKADISEQRDLSHKKPQIAARLKTLLEQQLRSMNARRALKK